MPVMKRIARVKQQRDLAMWRSLPGPGFRFCIAHRRSFSRDGAPGTRRRHDLIRDRQDRCRWNGNLEDQDSIASAAQTGSKQTPLLRIRHRTHQALNALSKAASSISSAISAVSTTLRLNDLLRSCRHRWQDGRSRATAEPPAIRVQVWKGVWKYMKAPK